VLRGDGGHQRRDRPGGRTAYLILLTAGVFVPPGRIPWVDALGQLMPLRHGLAAVRALLQGRPWQGELMLELVVGIGWAVAAWLIVRLQVRRARADGIDDFD
jgi:ABC-2 type transport system permease protein